MKNIKVLSLFDGISCARVALKKAKISVDAYYASEIDKYAIEISKKNYPKIHQLGCVKEVAKYKMQKFDLLIGGSPCQDLSIAKKGRKGLQGDRSGLFYEYVRILNEVKPKYFILENVNSMPIEARDTITKELFGIEPIMINAALVSAQNRKRLFWVGKINSRGGYDQIQISQPKDRNIYLKDIILDGKTEDLKSLCITATYHKKNERDFLKKRSGQMIRIGDIGSNAQAHRVYSTEGKSVALSALGGGQGAKTGLYLVNALTEARTEEAKKIRKEHKTKHGNDYCPRRGKELVPRTDGKANTITTGQTKESIIAIIQKGRGYNKGGEHKYKSPTLTSSEWQHNNHLQDGLILRKLHPIECERLQGLPDNYTDSVSNSQRYKACGNAFNVDVVAHILKFLK